MALPPAAVGGNDDAGTGCAATWGVLGIVAGVLCVVLAGVADKIVYLEARDGRGLSNGEGYIISGLTMIALPAPYNIPKTGVGATACSDAASYLSFAILLRTFSCKMY